VLEKEIEIAPGTSAMQALKMVAEVETAFGGGFVNEINNIGSNGGKASAGSQDWFFYINGIQSPLGAAEYQLRDGDLEHWDFHDWNFRIFIPATVGAFPETFRFGYGGKVRPTLIVSPAHFQTLAGELKKRFSQLGITGVDIRRPEELEDEEKAGANLIILGTAGDGLISELNDTWQRLGFFARMENNLIVYGADGEAVAEYGRGVGLVQATQNPWNPQGIGAAQNVVWMVTGIDEMAVRAAAKALSEDYSRFRYAYAIVIAEGEIIRVPR
jgi:hypothetical protein